MPMIIYYQHDDNKLATRKNHLKKDFQTQFTSFILINQRLISYKIGKRDFFKIEYLKGILSLGVI